MPSLGALVPRPLAGLLPIMVGMDLRQIECEVCGERLVVPDWREVKAVTRDADDTEPKTHLVIGGDRLLHACIIEE